MSLETRARAAVEQAHDRLATVPVPEVATVLRRGRRRRQVRTSIAIATAILGVAALVVPLATSVDRDGTSSVIGASGGTAPPRAGKAFVIEIDPDAIEVADSRGVNLTRLTRRSLAHIGGLLPDLERAVRVEVDRSRVIPQIGLGSGTDESGEVFVYLDPDITSREDLRVWMPVLLAREAHNSVRIRQGPGFGTTLGEWIVTEGLADAFAREAFPATPLAPWVEELTVEMQGIYWPAAQPVLDQILPDRDTRTELFNEWFFGTGSIPRWAGYTFGFEVVSAYLADGSDTAADLVDAPAAGILTRSPYDPPTADPERPRCYYPNHPTREIPCDNHEPAFALSGLVAEPTKCYVIGALTVSETQCPREGTAASDPPP